MSHTEMWGTSSSTLCQLSGWYGASIKSMDCNDRNEYAKEFDGRERVGIAALGQGSQGGPVESRTARKARSNLEAECKARERSQSFGSKDFRHGNLCQ